MASRIHQDFVVASPYGRGDRPTDREARYPTGYCHFGRYRTSEARLFRLENRAESSNSHVRRRRALPNTARFSSRFQSVYVRILRRDIGHLASPAAS